MEEAVLVGQGVRLAGDTGVEVTVFGISAEFLRGDKCLGRRGLGLRLEECGCPEVARPAVWLGLRLETVEPLFLLADVRGAGVGDALDGLGLGAEFRERVGVGDGEEGHLAAAGLAVAFLEGGGSAFVVARDGREGLVGDTLLDDVESEDADEGIAASDVVIEEGEGLALGVGFDPEGDATELDGEGVLVHAIDAVSDDVADGFADAFGGGLVLVGSDAGELLAQAACGSQQEMTGAAGGVNDADGEEGLLLGFCGVGALEALAHDGFEGGADELGDQVGRRVVGAGGLALGARVELEGGEAAGGGNAGLVIEKAFVDRTELFDVEGREVHAAYGGGLIVLVEYERLEGLQEMVIGNPVVVEVKPLEELAIQDGEAEVSGEGLPLILLDGRIVRQKFPEHAEAEPEIIVVGVGGGEFDEAAEAADAVVAQVVGVGADEASVLGHE